MDVLVAGASGFVGRRLCPALEEAGHVVRAMTRHPDDYQGVGEPVRGDVTDADSLAAAAQGCDAAYYLVHSLELRRTTRRQPGRSAPRRPGPGSARSCTSADWGGTRTSCPRTCAAAVRSNDYSGTPACLSRRCVPESSSVTAVSPGR